MFEKKERASIVVYFTYLNDVKKLQRIGDLVYVSQRGRYAVIYMDQEQVGNHIERLSSEKYVKCVLPSHIKALEQPFVGNLWRSSVKTPETRTKNEKVVQE